MQDGKPPTTPTSKATPSNSKSVSPTSGASANGGKQGGAGKTGAPGGRGGGGEGLASLAAKMMGAKGKKQGNTETSGVNETSRQRQNGCLDDLPLGSEAHSLSLDQANGIDRNLAPSDKRPSLLKTASQGIMGWQSFNSDVSNQTSASSASLEMLLNERQVDPEAMLLNLGFGGEGQSYVPYLARVPQRFLHHPSRAYGIDLPDMADRVDGEAGDETVTGTPVGNSGSPSAAPPAKKRTGGFYFLGLYFWPCYGYVDMINLVMRDVPLYFFNEEGTKCYVTSRTLEGLKRKRQKTGVPTPDAAKASRRLTRAKTKRASSRVGAGMKDKKGVEIKGKEEEENLRKRGRKIGVRTSGSQLLLSSKENVIPEEEVRGTTINTEVMKTPEKPEKKLGRFLDMTYLKTAARKIGDTITGKISRKQEADVSQSSNRSYSSSPKAQRKGKTRYLEPPSVKTKDQSLSSSLSSLPAYPHLTSKLRVSSLLPNKKAKETSTVSCSPEKKTNTSVAIETKKRIGKTTSSISSYPHLVSKLSVSPFIGGSNILSQDAKLKHTNQAQGSISNKSSSKSQRNLPKTLITKDVSVKKTAAGSKSRSKKATNSNDDVRENTIDSQDITTSSNNDLISPLNRNPSITSTIVKSQSIMKKSSCSLSHSPQPSQMAASVSSSLCPTPDPVFVQEIRIDRNVTVSSNQDHLAPPPNTLHSSKKLDNPMSESHFDQSVVQSHADNNASNSQNLGPLSSSLRSRSGIPNLENKPTASLSDKQDDVCNVTFVCKNLQVNPIASDSLSAVADSSSKDKFDSPDVDSKLEKYISDSSTTAREDQSISHVGKIINRNIGGSFKAKTSQSIIAASETETESRSNIIDPQKNAPPLDNMTSSFSELDSVQTLTPTPNKDEISNQSALKGHMLSDQDNAFIATQQNESPTICLSKLDDINESTLTQENVATTKLNGTGDHLDSVTSLRVLATGETSFQDSSLNPGESLAPCGSDISETVGLNGYDLPVAVSTLEDDDDDISSVDDMNCSEDNDSEYEDTQANDSIDNADLGESDSEGSSCDDFDIAESASEISDDYVSENDNSDDNYSDVVEDTGLEWCYDGESLNLNQVSVTPSVSCDILSIPPSSSCDNPLSHSLLCNPSLSPSEQTFITTTAGVPYPSSHQDQCTKYPLQHLSTAEVSHSERTRDVYPEIGKLNDRPFCINIPYSKQVVRHLSLRESGIKLPIRSNPYIDRPTSHNYLLKQSGSHSEAIADSSQRISLGLKDDLANLKGNASEIKIESLCRRKSVESSNLNLWSSSFTTGGTENSYNAQSLEQSIIEENAPVSGAVNEDEGLELGQNSGDGHNSSTLSGITEEDLFISPLYKTVTTELHSGAESSTILPENGNTNPSSRIFPTRPTHFNITRNRKTLSSEQRYVRYIKTVEPRKVPSKPVNPHLKRRTSTGSLRPAPLLSPTSLPSSNSSYSWLLPSKSADDFDKLSERDKQGVDMSNVSTSSSDSEDDGTDRRGNSFSPSFPEKRLWFS